MRSPESSWFNLRGWQFFIVCLALFIGGMLNDPPWKSFSFERRFEPYGESAHVALNLHRTGEFADPYAPLPTGPTAHVAPGYPFVQAKLLDVFGDGPWGWLAVRTLGSSLQSAQYALLPWVAVRFGLGAWTGVLAGLLGILVKAPREEMWEAQIAGVLMMLLALTMQQTKLWSGVLAGLSFLVQPVLTLPWMTWALWRRKYLAVGLALAMVLPWVLATRQRVGAWTWIRGNLGLELSLSFNDCAAYGARENESNGCFLRLHPNASGAVATDVRRMGETAFNRRRMSEALAWIRSHPAGAVSLIAQRVWFFWFPADHGFASYTEQRKRFLVLHVLTVLSFLSLWGVARRAAPILVLWSMLFPIPYYLLQFETRYRLPLLWLTYLLAAHAIVTARRAIMKNSLHVAL